MVETTFQFSEYLDNTLFYCGIDVHKRQITVSMLAVDETGHEHDKLETFSTTKDGLEHFWGFVRKYRPVSFAMEATNVYHHVVSNLLFEKRTGADWEYDVIVASPPDVAGIPGRPKNDRIDATLLARYLRAGFLVAGRRIDTPLEDIRGLFRSAATVSKDRTRLKNRIKKTLDRAGLRPAGFDLNAHWARDLVYYLTDHDGTFGSYFNACIERGGPMSKHVTYLVRNKVKFESYFDVTLTQGQKTLIRQALVELEFKTAQNAMLSVEIDGIIASCPGLRQKIMNIASVPGISPYSAAWLVAEVGDLERFKGNKRKFLAYCGCCPKEKKSDKVVYSSHISRKSNKHARGILYHAAKALCFATRRESCLRVYANKVVANKRHRSMTLAFMIVAGKIARIVFAIMRDNVPFDTGMAGSRTSPRKNGVFTTTDKKLLRRALRDLRRVASLEHMKRLSLNAAYFANALERALGEN
jgi:transposase